MIPHNNGSTFGQLVVYREEEHQRHPMEALMLAAHYIIVLPVLLLCWVTCVRCMRRHGIITRRRADDLLSERQMSELRRAGEITSRIVVPPPPPPIFNAR